MSVSGSRPNALPRLTRRQRDPHRTPLDGLKFARTSAMSVSGSRPSTLPSPDRPSGSVTRTVRASSTTWLLVTISAVGRDREALSPRPPRPPTRGRFAPRPDRCGSTTSATSSSKGVEQRPGHRRRNPCHGSPCGILSEKQFFRICGETWDGAPRGPSRRSLASAGFCRATVTLGAAYRRQPVRAAPAPAWFRAVSRDPARARSRQAGPCASRGNSSRSDRVGRRVSYCRRQPGMRRADI